MIARKVLQLIWENMDSFKQYASTNWLAAAMRNCDSTILNIMAVSQWHRNRPQARLRLRINILQFITNHTFFLTLMHHVQFPSSLAFDTRPPQGFGSSESLYIFWILTLSWILIDKVPSCDIPYSKNHLCITSPRNLEIVAIQPCTTLVKALELISS